MPRWIVLEYLRENPEDYRKMVEKRGLDTSIVDQAIKIDKEYLDLLKEIERLRSEKNKLSLRVREASENERKIIIDEIKSLSRRLEEMEDRFKAVEGKRKSILMSLPNILGSEVPVGFSEEDNVPVRFGGVPVVPRDKLDIFKQQTSRWGFSVEHVVTDRKYISHADMLEKTLRMGDTLQAGRVAGSRFYYLYDDLVWLDFALSLYALNLLAGKGYRVVIPPYMIRVEILKAALDYDAFKDMIYKIEGEDLSLIGTAEHPLMAILYRNPVREDELPVKLAGWSACFRKEAGAGNRDLKGIFRVHQFHKVEQFVFAHPENSWEIFEEMVRNTEEIVSGLELPYRVVKVVSGELGMPAAMKYDLEVWYPSQGRYREIASISQVLDWQAFRGDLTFIRKSDGRREYVHTLNGTGIPTTRAITAILENHQREDGVVEIPKVLRKFLEPIPNAPKDEIRPRNK